MKKTGKFVKCSYCGKLVYKQKKCILKSKKLFCNMFCYSQSQIGKKIWNKGLKGIHLSPKTEFKKGQRNSPNTEFKKGQISLNKGKKYSLELRNRLSKSHKGQFAGEKHPHWMGGISFEPYGMEFNKKLKKEIRKRDNYTCQECGYKQSKLKYKLIVHHIDFNKRNNNQDNLISLCRNCHGQTNFNRSKWVNYFKRKVKYVIVHKTAIGSVA